MDSYLYMDINEGALGNIAATKNGEWEEVKTRFEAPSTPIKLRLVCNALAKGEKVYVDDIKLAQVNSSLDRVDGVPDRSLAINGAWKTVKTPLRTTGIRPPFGRERRKKTVLSPLTESI